MSTEEIGNMVIEELRRLDQVAYVRFASVYRRFEDVSQFMDELRHLSCIKRRLINGLGRVVPSCLMHPTDHRHFAPQDAI